VAVCIFVIISADYMRFTTDCCVICTVTLSYQVTNEAASPGVSTGPASWVLVNAANARADAVTKGCSKYARPEDAEIIGRTLYVSITGENRCANTDTVTLLPIQCSAWSRVNTTTVNSTAATAAALSRSVCAVSLRIYSTCIDTATARE
jgi:hypothetical protein